MSTLSASFRKIQTEQKELSWWQSQNEDFPQSKGRNSKINYPPPPTPPHTPDSAIGLELTADLVVLGGTPLET